MTKLLFYFVASSYPLAWAVKKQTRYYESLDTEVIVMFV